VIKPAKIQVRLTDIDILGHVNNAIYLSYFEMTRIHYFNLLVGPNWDWMENGVVLVHNEVQYIQPIFLADTPEIQMFCNKIGNKSFTLSYEVYVNGQLKTTGSSTLVGFNSNQQKSIEIPALMREALQKLPKK
jgi:acyl-CoA thioester hydrolase